MKKERVKYEIEFRRKIMSSPKVAILLPIYKPNIDWLVEQLVSVNEQTYGNMEIFVYLDDPEDKTDYAAILQEHITKMPFTLQKGEKNLGSNKAFEKLTYMAKEKGDFKYIAFCDQDDVWLPEKIDALVSEAEKSDSDLVCSEMEVIDEQDEKIYDKFAEINVVTIMNNVFTIADIIKNYVNNENIFDTLLQFNLFTGCSMLVSTRAAFAALPFSKYEWYDHWIALYVAGTSKNLTYFNTPLLKRRFHQNNQTVALKDDGINEKVERINFLDDLRMAFKDKKNIFDKAKLQKAFFQNIGEVWWMQQEAERETSYKII